MNPNVENIEVVRLVEQNARVAGQVDELAAILRELRQPARRTVRTFAASAASGTTITLEAEPVLPGFCWLIERLSYYCSDATTSATVYMDTVDNGQILDFTNVGSTSVSDQNQPIFLPGGSRLVVQWTGVTTPATANLHIQYRIEPLYPGV